MSLLTLDSLAEFEAAKQNYAPCHREYWLGCGHSNNNPVYSSSENFSRIRRFRV